VIAWANSRHVSAFLRNSLGEVRLRTLIFRAGLPANRVLHHNTLALIVSQLDSATAAASAAFSSGARTSPRDRGQAHADGCKKKLMSSVYNFVQ
jgi:hypothetical protein